tara:strand:+ start:473 stop:1402 length:930 start_codon:yes stop_codon:yes gene_type:complete
MTTQNLARIISPKSKSDITHPKTTTPRFDSLSPSIRKPDFNNRHQGSQSLKELSNENTCQEHLLQKNGYTISRVNSLKQRIKTNTFIKHMYASRGYLTESATAFSDNPNQITFQASIDEIIVGTVTLQIDSDKGLLADELYQRTIDEFRKKGRKVCELSKFALDPQHSSKEIIASLFQVAYIYAHKIYKATDYFCEVNPRHAGPQKRMFGFRQIGKQRTCPRVDAPAVLLHLEMNYVDEQITSLEGSSASEHRSLYSYFLTKHDKVKLVNKIQSKLIEKQLSSRLQTKTKQNQLPFTDNWVKAPLTFDM